MHIATHISDSVVSDSEIVLFSHATSTLNLIRQFAFCKKAL